MDGFKCKWYKTWDFLELKELFFELEKIRKKTKMAGASV
jgi:hypothetical protein